MPRGRPTTSPQRALDTPPLALHHFWARWGWAGSPSTSACEIDKSFETIAWDNRRSLTRKRPATANEGDEALNAYHPDDAWAESLRVVMREVIGSLPDHATLGELVDAARKNRAMSPVLDIFTVQELIDIAKKRPKPLPPPREPAEDEIRFDADGNPIMDLDAGPKVIRRRADVPDGDVRVLRCLAQRGAQRETDLANQTNLTSEQLRIIVRHLRTKGYIHIEGSGTKRAPEESRATAQATSASRSRKADLFWRSAFLALVPDQPGTTMASPMMPVRQRIAAE